MDAEEMARAALELEAMGCHNLNFVTPTHHVDLVAEAIRSARQAGLTVPVVYNCGGYESPETLARLKGLVEIYMPDVKFFDARASRKYLNAPDYPEVVKKALKIMHAQVGDLSIESGLASRGLLVRHLVMPGFTRDALAIMEFLHAELSPRTYVNIMAQYWPRSDLEGFDEIQRPASNAEVVQIIQKAEALGLRISG